MCKRTLVYSLHLQWECRKHRRVFLTFHLLLSLCLTTRPATATELPQERPPVQLRRVAVVAPDENAPRILEQGKPIDRSLKGGESHSYQIALTADQCLNVVADQQGIDVVLTLLAPDGSKIVEVDSPNGTEGPERLSAIAESTGIFRLVVRSLEENAAAGRYRLTVEGLRTATDQDRTRIENARKSEVAQHIFDEAEQLRAKGTGESLHAAMAKYQEVIPLFRALGNHGGEALALNLVGGSHYLTGEFKEALEYYNQALRLLRTIGDKKEVAVTLNNIGLTYSLLGKRQEALDSYRLALPLHKEAGNRNAEASTLHNIGLVHAELGDNQQAVQYYEEALGIARALGDKPREASTLNVIGVLHATAREYPKALECYTLALSLNHETGDRQGEGVTLHHLGDAYRSSGDLDHSLEFLNRAFEVETGAGDRLSASFALGSIGEVLRLKGDRKTALEKLGEALAMSRGIRAPEPELRCLGSLARTYREMGLPGETRLHIEAALDLYESLRTRVTSRTLRASSLSRAQANYEFYVDFLMSSRSDHPEYVAEALKVSERARARGLLELLNEAETDDRRGADPTLLARADSIRRELDAKAVARTRLLAHNHTGAQAAAADKEVSAITARLDEVESQIRTSNPAYGALVQPRPLSLAEIQQLLDADTTLLEYALGDERSYVWAVTPTSVTSYQLPPRAEIESSARKVYEMLIAQRPKAQSKAATPRGRNDSATADYERQAAALSRMLLDPAASRLSAKRLLIVAPGALQYVPFAVLPSPARAAESNEASRGDHRQPARSAVRTQTSSPAQPLIVDHEIVSLPSASVLAVLRREIAGRPAAKKAIAVLADPVFAKDDPRVSGSAKGIEKATTGQSQMSSRSFNGGPRSDLERAVRDVRSSNGREGLARLPFSREEAEAILAVTTDQSTLKALDFKANRETATSDELSQYRVVHFATHGLLDAEHPELSGLVLSLVDEEGRSQDGFLRLHEIYDLRLPADVVVLSACETGLGKDMKGEGLVGLTRGFMHAGAASVVASLWEVDDIATAQLMKRFYRGMFKERLRPAAALRSAQVDMWKHAQWQGPYYWGGFVLQGEWR